MILVRRPLQAANVPTQPEEGKAAQKASDGGSSPICGTVVDDLDHPVAGTAISWHTLTLSGVSEEPISTTTSGSAGAFQLPLPELQPSLGACVSAFKPGVGMDVIPLVPGALPAALNFHLSRDGSTAGWVVDTEGTPVCEARVVVCAVARATWRAPVPSVIVSETDATGRFQLMDLPAGVEVELLISAPGHALASIHAASGDQRLVCELPKGAAATGTVIADKSWGQSSAPQLYASTGALVALDPGGAFSITSLPEDIITFAPDVVGCNGSQAATLSTVRVPVTARRDTQIELHQVESIAVRGRVIERPAGNELSPAARIRAMASDPDAPNTRGLAGIPVEILPLRQITWTDGSGGFCFNVPEGQYEIGIAAVPPGYRWPRPFPMALRERTFGTSPHLSWLRRWRCGLNRPERNYPPGCAWVHPDAVSVIANAGLAPPPLTMGLKATPRIMGRVTSPDGSPAANACLTIGNILAGYTNALGDFEIAFPDDLAWKSTPILLVSHWNASGWRRLPERFSERVCDLGDIALESNASCQGRLLDSRKRGISSVQLTVRLGSHEASFDRYDGVLTDGEGRFRFNHLTAGLPCRILPTHETAPFPALEVSPIAGRTADLGDITLGTTSDVTRITISDKDGRPVGGAELIVLTADNRRRMATTDDRGLAECAGLPRDGFVRLLVVGRDWCDYRRIRWDTSPVHLVVSPPADLTAAER